MISVATLTLALTVLGSHGARARHLAHQRIARLEICIALCIQSDRTSKQYSKRGPNNLRPWWHLHCLMHVRHEPHDNCWHATDEWC